MNKKQKSGSSKVLIVTCAVCGAIIAILLFILIFADMIAGRALLSKTREGIAGSDAVVLFDPSYNESILPTSGEAVLTGDAAKQMAERILSVTENVSFHNVLTSSAGFWDVSMRFDDGNDTYTVYLREDDIYVVKNDKGYVFKVDKSVKEEYTILGDSVRALIAETAQNAQ